MANDYPLIENLMSAYLNQDFDYICESNTIDGAIDYYIRESSEKMLMSLLDELKTFEAQNTDRIEQAFEEKFRPEVIIPDVRDFFSTLSKKIVAARN